MTNPVSCYRERGRHSQNRTNTTEKYFKGASEDTFEEINSFYPGQKESQ